MRYVFLCDECMISVEFYRTLKEGPPPEKSEERNCPECQNEMRHDFGGNFILKGDGWPGKTITRDNEGTTTSAKAEKMFHKHDVARKEGDEVLSERRKGTESFKTYEKNNRAKVKRYFENRTQGITKPK
ncbi:hypothetical protein KAR91_86940 [Candidatus Pacearchaeota archaeon]|nr:hypothetical protein [Candidatus Pacearchaeota archaeon]